ncbi:hypothetical protein Droror1_Dr00010242, partial [Drosera rotundifolia]
MKLVGGVWGSVCDRGFESTRAVNIPNLFEIAVVLFRFKGKELVLRRGTIRACCLGVCDSLLIVDLGLIRVLDLSKLGLCWVYCREVEFSHFYANLLYEAASEQKEYEKVIAKCEYSLNIADPLYPAKEGLSEENGGLEDWEGGRIL